MRDALYGLMAEFDSADDLVRASQKAYDAGYREMDAYTPFPIHGLSDAIGFKKNFLPYLVLGGGISGGLGGYLLQYYASVLSYPLNIGGRPFHSWPSFIPVTFEMTILGAAFAAVFGMLALNGLPLPYHPVFNVERFELASRTHFFLCIEARDRQFDRKETEKFLKTLKPQGVYEVPA